MFLTCFARAILDVPLTQISHRRSVYSKTLSGPSCFEISRLFHRSKDEQRDGLIKERADLKMLLARGDHLLGAYMHVGFEVIKKANPSLSLVQSRSKYCEYSF